MKGLSGVIVTIILLLVTVAIAGMFVIWSNAASNEFEETTSGQVVRDLDKINSAIVISDISNNIVSVKNIGDTDLSINIFSIFVDGELISNPIFNRTGSISTGDVVGIDVGTNAECSDVRVTGQYDTLDIYEKEEYFFNTIAC